jgi:hypothetical protein
MNNSPQVVLEIFQEKRSLAEKTIEACTPMVESLLATDFKPRDIKKLLQLEAHIPACSLHFVHLVSLAAEKDPPIHNISLLIKIVKLGTSSSFTDFFFAIVLTATVFGHDVTENILANLFRQFLSKTI